MNLMINISEEDYEVFKKQHVVINSSSNARDRLFNAVKNGIPIPDNATNGDVIKALFPNEYDFETDFDEVWWNALYQKGGK